MLRISTLAVLFASLCACNRYELFRVSGYAQEDFSNDADVLFVIDNSSSMVDEAEALALNFDTFIRRLTDPSEGAASTDGLTDATDNYITYVQNRSFIVDYQLGISTTDVAGTYGALYGESPVLTRSDTDIATQFNRNLLCSATCFNDADTVPSDPEYVCEDPPPPPGDQISQQYLDCLCGSTDAWEGNCGSGNEEHLEAVYMAMCRAVPDPPADCYDEINQFTDDDVGTNAPMIRDDSTVIPVIVTDEGDTSRRMTQGDDEPDEYAELFDKFNKRMAWAVIGPRTDVCNSGGATTWGVERLQYFVDETNGLYVDIETPDENGDCAAADFATAMEQLGNLLNNLLTVFPLQSVPDVDTILVFVDDQPVDRASETFDEETGEITYGDGWSYLAAENAVEFHGDAVPDYNAKVRIYYLPLEGMPRELPF